MESDDDNETLTKIASPIFRVPIEIFYFSPISKGFPAYDAVTQESFLLVEAPDEIGAVNIAKNYYGYWKNYNMQTSQTQRDMSPFRINKKVRIERILDCELRRKTQNGEYACEIPVSHESFMECRDNLLPNEILVNSCCVEGSPIPDFPGCPYSELIDDTD